MMSAHTPGFTAYDITRANENNAVIPPAVAPTIAPAPIPQRLTHENVLMTFTFPTVSSSSASKEIDDNDDGPPVPPQTTHAPI
jgi:hypothetical protein